MTAQFPDTLMFHGREYYLVGVKGKGLFDPQRLGLSPAMAGTACWRGYRCEYVIKDAQLLLNRLCMSLGSFEGRNFHPQSGPQINAVAPAKSKGRFARVENQMFNNVYEGLNLDVTFSGGLLIADELIRELIVHMGFHPAWKYRTVMELLFEVGILMDARDVSGRMAELRDQKIERPLAPGQGATHDEIHAWVESTFRLDYEL